LLDISKLDAGAIEPDVTTFPIQLLLDNVIADNAPHATQKGLSLRVMPSSYLVRSDAGLLERIVENFVTNAIRYTETGRMLVGCRRRRNQVRIEVWDTGVGIPEDALKTIFEEYFQLDNPARDRSKGLGLGLAIVDSIARLLGHQIDVTSTLNKGSIFAVEVPLAGRMKPQATQEQLVENRSENGISVLFVDDDPAIISAMRLLMEVTGYRITTAMSGSEAIAALTGIGDPDVIVSDFRLSNGETGTDVVQRLRDAIGAEIPAIVLTGDTSLQHIQAANLPHCSMLHKPADGDKLIALIDRIAGL
jgi:two-component system CheB/CheR fusion protein